jgi:hypothetical protein
MNQTIKKLRFIPSFINQTMTNKSFVKYPSNYIDTNFYHFLNEIKTPLK